MPFTIQPVDTVPDFGPPGATGAPKFSVVPVDTAPDFGDAPDAGGSGVLHEFGQGIKGGLRYGVSLPISAGATIAERIGAPETMETLDALAQAIRDEGDKYTAQNPTIGSIIKDPNKLGAAAKWLSYNMGQAAGTSVPAFVGSLAAGIAAPAASTGLGVGALLSYLTGVGDVRQSEQDAGGETNPKLELGMGIPYAALDFLPGSPIITARKLLGAHLADTAAGGLFKRLRTEIPKALGGEFINEAGQQVIDDVAAGLSTGRSVEETLKDPEVQKDIAEAGASGMAGGLIPGILSAVRAPKIKAALEQPEPEDQRTPAQRFSIEPVDVAPDFGGSTSFDDVVASIHKQESGGRETAKTSVTGARGGMQIQPATFSQYARPGESIDNPADNSAVGRRIIADLWNKSGGDPARVAVGYFSGPGNIAPAGAATPWKRDAADPTGKTTSSYVEDVLERLGRGGLPWIGQDEPKRKDVEFEKLPDQTPAPNLAQIEAALLLGRDESTQEDVAAPLREAIAPSQEESAAEIPPVSEPILTAPTQKAAQNIPENIPSGVAGASATSQLPVGTPVRVKLKDGTYAGDGAVGTVIGYVEGKRPRVKLEGFTGLKAPFSDLVTLETVGQAGETKPKRAADDYGSNTKSWVAVDKKTGKGVYETYDQSVADKINAEKYDVVPVGEYLGALNRKAAGSESGKASPQGGGASLAQPAQPAQVQSAAQPSAPSTEQPAPITTTSPETAPVVKTDEATPEQRPSLGSTVDEVMNEWKKIDGDWTKRTNTESTVGRMIPGGTFDFQGGKIWRLEPATKKALSSRREATDAEIREIRDAIESGSFQIETRQNQGVGAGYREFSDFPNRVFHQATGRALEGTAAAKRQAEEDARRQSEKPAGNGKTAAPTAAENTIPATTLRSIKDPVSGREYTISKQDDGWSVSFMVDGASNGRRGLKTEEDAKALVKGWMDKSAGDVHHLIRAERVQQEESAKDLARHEKSLERARTPREKKQLKGLVAQKKQLVENAKRREAELIDVARGLDLTAEQRKAIWGEEKFKEEPKESASQAKFRDRLDKFGAARSETADYKIAENNSGTLELSRTRDGKREVIASGGRDTLLDRAAEDAFATPERSAEGDLESAIKRGQEVAKEYRNDVIEPHPDVLLQVYGQMLRARGVERGDPHPVMQFFHMQKKYDGGLNVPDLLRNYEVYAESVADKVEKATPFEKDRYYSSASDRDGRIREAERDAKRYTEGGKKFASAWTRAAEEAEAMNPGSPAAKRIRDKIAAVEKEAADKSKEYRALAEKIENEPFTERQPGWRLLTEVDDKPTVVQVTKVSDKLYVAGDYYSNGHMILKNGQLPTLRKRLAAGNPEPVQVPEDRLLGYLNKKKVGGEFEPTIEYNPKADPSSKPESPVVYGKVGGKDAAVNGIYYHFLTNNGVVIKGMADVNDAPLFGLWKGNAQIGSLAGVRSKADEITLAEAQAKLARDATPKASLFGPWRSPRDRDRIAKRVVEIVRQIAPQTGVETVDDLKVRVGGRDLPGGGQFDPVKNLVTVALNFGDPEVTAEHEAIHALRNAGLFTPQEWATLEKAAKDRWIDELGVRDIYRGVPDDVVTEEAIAQRFAEWRKQPAKELPAVRRAFTKIRDFFRRLANALRGMGFRTAEDVFEAAERGEVGRREPASGGAGAGSAPGPRASLFNTLKRQAAPVLKQPAQKPGTNAQKSAVDRIFGTGHTPFRERVRAAIHDYSDRQFLKAKQAILDQFASVKALERETRGETATGSRSPYKSIRLTRNLHSVMAYVLRHGPIAVGKQKDGGVWFGRLKGWDKGGFEDIFKPIADKGLLDLWRGWAVAVRADRLMREGRENLMTRAEINALLPLGRQYPEFVAAHKKWQAFNKAMLDMAEASGLINAEQRALWENADYIPFFRVMEDEVFGPSRGKSGVANQRSGIRKLKGGTAQLNDPIENMVMNMTILVDRSFKNLAARKVVALALEAGVMERERYDWRKDQLTPEDAARELGRIGVQVTGMTPQQHAQMLNFWRMQAPTDPNVISVMVGGKPQFFRVHDPMLLQSLTSMTPQQLTGVLGIFRMAKRLLTELITITPDFMSANAVKDTLSAYLLSGSNGFRPFIDSVRGFRKALDENDPIKLDIMANGGGLAGFYGTSPEDARKYIERHVGRLGGESIMDTPRKLWEGWHKIGHASESANRIAIAEAVKKNGGSEAEQAYQAMDLLDFGMRGASASMRVLIETIPFLNARIQGLYRLGRGAKENPKAFLLRGSIIAAASLALLAENWDNPEYEALEDWDKDTYWHLWIPGVPVPLRLPKPFEVGALFGTIPERMARAYFGKDDMRAAWKATKFMLQSTFQIDMPQLVAPLVEQWANKDTSTGRPIVGADLEKLPAWMQYGPDTSETAREAGAALNKILPKDLEALSSPERIEKLVGGYFGTLGTYLLALSDQAVRLAGDYPSDPTLRIDDIPVVKRFVRSAPQRNTRFLTEFYELKNEVDKTASAVRELGKRGETDAAEKYVEERAGDLAVAKVLDKAAKAMTNLRLAEQSIMRDRQMTPAQKRKAIDEITTDRNAMAEEFVGYAKTMRVMNGIANAP